MGQVTPAEQPDPRRQMGLADQILVGLAALAVAAIAIYIMFAIAGSLFRFEVPDELLIVSEMMLLVIFPPMAFLVRRDLFIKVDVLAGKLSEGVQHRLDYLANIFGLLFFGLLGIAGWHAFHDSWAYGTLHMGNVELPEWIGRGVLLLGVVGGFVMQAMVLIRRLLGR